MESPTEAPSRPLVEQTSWQLPLASVSSPRAFCRLPTLAGMMGAQNLKKELTSK
ncbi:hypothetical protein QO004_002097 [Rhizobium mesoamericanum]|nr:hypothetical protein [Rhizobium mesoamericanum]